MESKGLRVALRIWVGLVLAFLFVPIVLIVLYSFNSSNIESWPITGVSRWHWFTVAWRGSRFVSAFLLSVQVGRSPPSSPCCSAPRCRTHCTLPVFGRERSRLLFVLPLALPGVVTGVALNSFSASRASRSAC